MAGASRVAAGDRKGRSADDASARGAAGDRRSRSATPEALRSADDVRGNGAAGDRNDDDVRGNGDGMAFAHPEQEAARREAAAREGQWQAAMRARRGGGDALAGQKH